VVRQLRLRDIGGIIVVDFIDMLDQKNAKKVYDSMKTELRNDRAKSNILPMSDFGIMQIPAKEFVRA
jgi:ribonuclease G